MNLFFAGTHQPSDCGKLAAEGVPSFVSVERLWNRKGDFEVGDWIMDCGSFGRMRDYAGLVPIEQVFRPILEYAAKIVRFKRCGNLRAAVSPDLMCEPFMIEKSGLTVCDHQRLTVTNYDALLRCETGVYIMPVLQGYEPEEYVDCIRAYGDRLKPGMWVGVGSICKRNTKIDSVRAVLRAIQAERPDLLLHGFGLKITALSDGEVWQRLYSSDSMAWSLRARMQGRNGNDWREALGFNHRIWNQPIQWPLFMEIGQ